MDLGFKLQYIYCWLCFVKEYNRPLYLTDDVVLENLNTITFGKDTENDAGKYVKRFGGSKVLIHYGGGSR